MSIQLGADRAAAAPFTTPAEFLAAVRRQGQQPGADLDPRLRQYAGVYVDDERPDGFVLPAAWAPTVLSRPSEVDPAIGRMTVVPMSWPITHVNARVDENHTTSVAGGLVVGRSIAAVSTAASRLKMEQVQLQDFGTYGFNFTSDRVLADSFPAFAAVLEAGFRDAFDGLFLEERIWGSGVGEFAGIMNSGALITVAKDGGQAATTITGTNLVNMRARCWRYSNAVWMANHDAWLQIQKATIASGTGVVPVWQAGDESSGSPDMVLGRPLFLCENCATLGTVGDVVLVDWSQYLDGQYKPMEALSSIHVRYQAVETAFRFTVRNGGAPWWRAALTPKRSATTLSPYVALATRA